MSAYLLRKHHFIFLNLYEKPLPCSSVTLPGGRKKSTLAYGPALVEEMVSLTTGRDGGRVRANGMWGRLRLLYQIPSPSKRRPDVFDVR